MSALTESRHAESRLRGAHGSMSVSKYLIEASYTADGVKGVLKEGGSGRRAAMVRQQPRAIPG